MKKSVIRFICILLLLLLPLSCAASVGFLIKPQFSKLFTAELYDKVERLDSIKEPKIVIVSGSSAAFGLNSKLLEDTLGMPVVNFGLYASIGTKAMMDLSRKSIRKGDIIVLAPEMDSQLLSLYFGADSLWQACDGHFGLLMRLSRDDAPAMLGAYWKFAASKFRYSRGTPLEPTGVYAKSAFNEYGDIDYPDRKYNVMAQGYDPAHIIDFSPDIVSQDFIDYVNEYIEYAKKRGATVYFGFAPMNMSALREGTEIEDIEAFEAFLAEKLKAPLLGSANGYIYNEAYFYDSNFHMNEAGVILHTRRLALDLADVLGGIKVDIAKPDKPIKPDKPDDPMKYDENEKYFVFEERAGSTYITGVSDEGKKLSSLRIPTAYNGKRGIIIGAGAFADCGELTELFVTDNVSYISDGAFVGAGKLMKIHILAENPDSTTVNGMGSELTAGLPAGARFYVPNASLGSYVGNYFWSTFADRIVGE